MAVSTENPKGQKVLAALLMSAGFVFMGAAAYSALLPREFPYKTVSKDADVIAGREFENASKLGKLEEVEWRSDQYRDPLATAIIARESNGRPTSLKWTNNVTEPVISADISDREVEKVTRAIREHVPADAVVLSWWDNSRRIRLLSERDAPLDDPLVRGILLPATWSDVANDARKKERAYWGDKVPAELAKTFETYLAALMLDEEKGAKELSKLAGSKTAYVAVHLSDVWKLAAEKQDELAIAYKDFPGAGSHSVMKSVKSWLSEQKISGAFAIEPIGNAIRVHYFAKPGEENRLILKMLPFSTSNPMSLKALKLVYQHRGFWIYKIASAN